jgi:hypothetical protein
VSRTARAVALAAVAFVALAIIAAPAGSALGALRVGR